jgi:hypothetical protein
MLYLFLAIILLWRGYSAGSPALLSMGATAGALALLSSLFSRGSMSFEAKLLALIVVAISLMGYSREGEPAKAREKRPVEEESGRGPGD